MDKNSEKNVRFRINITLLIAVVLLVADLYAMIQYASEIYYSWRSLQHCFWLQSIFW